jgi:hypothetical protein
MVKVALRSQNLFRLGFFSTVRHRSGIASGATPLEPSRKRSGSEINSETAFVLAVTHIALGVAKYKLNNIFLFLFLL